MADLSSVRRMLEALRHGYEVKILFNPSNAGYGVKVSPNDLHAREASLLVHWKKQENKTTYLAWTGQQAIETLQAVLDMLQRGKNVLFIEGKKRSGTAGSDCSSGEPRIYLYTGRQGESFAKRVFNETNAP